MAIKICRICLATDVKVFKLGNSEAKCFIENVFKENGYRQDLNESHYICFVCKALLDKSYNFIRRVLKAQEILSHVLKENKKITLLSFKQIDRQMIGFNLVKDFKYIDVYIAEDDNDIKKENKSNALQGVECNLEVDEILTPNPLENPSDKCDFDTEKKDIDLGVHLKNDSCETDSKVDMKIHFNNDDPYDEELIYTPFDNIDNEIQYEFDETVHIERIKEEIVDENVTEIEINESRKLNYQSRVSKTTEKAKKSPSKTASKRVQPSRSVRNKNNRKRKLKKQKGKKLKYTYGRVDSSRPIQQPEVPNYPAKCDHCSYEVPNRTAHFRHYLVEHKDKKYPYAKQTGKQFVCQFCGRVNDKKQRHIDHELTHGTVKNFACTQCPKSFVNNHRLQQHTYRTHPLQMLECDYCGKKVKARPSLMIHMRIHTGERPFKCPFCGAGFAHKGNIRPHIRANHEHCLERSDFPKKKNKGKARYEATG